MGWHAAHHYLEPSCAADPFQTFHVDLLLEAEFPGPPIEQVSADGLDHPAEGVSVAYGARKAELAAGLMEVVVALRAQIGLGVFEEPPA